MTPSPHLLSIGASIRAVRTTRGLSHSQLSKITGMDPSNLSDIENGKQNLTIETLVKLASALRCVVDVNFSPVE